jgi:hypothetical protein
MISFSSWQLRMLSEGMSRLKDFYSMQKEPESQGLKRVFYFFENFGFLEYTFHFLGASSKLRKATISLAMSVSSSVFTEQLFSHWFFLLGGI